MRRVFRRFDSWKLGVVLLGLAMGILIARSPIALAVGLTLFSSLLVLGLERPLALVALLLLTAWVPFRLLGEGGEGPSGSPSAVQSSTSSVNWSVRGGGSMVAGADLNLSGVRLMAVVLGLALYLPLGRLNITRWRGGQIYLLLLAWAAVTLLYAPLRMEGLRDLFKLAYPWLLFEVLMREVKGPRMVHSLIRVLLAGLLLGTAAGFLLPLFHRRIYSTFVAIERVVAQFYWWISWASFAFFVSVVALLCYGLALYHPAHRRVYLSLWGIGVLDVVLTCVRMPLGALSASWAFMEWHYSRKRALALIPLIAIGLFLVLMVFLEQRMFYSGTNLSTGSLGAIKLSGRSLFWGIAVQHLSLGTLLQGQGLGAYMQLSKQTLGFYYPVHNDYLKLLLETGLIGLGLFLTAHAWFIQHLRKLAATAQRPLTQALLLAAPAAHVCYLVGSLTDNGIWYYAPFSGPVWCLTALALRSWDLEQSPENAPKG